MAAKGARRLADDRIDAAARDRQPGSVGDDRDIAALRRIAAAIGGAIEPALARRCGQGASLSPVSSVNSEPSIRSPQPAETK